VRRLAIFALSVNISPIARTVYTHIIDPVFTHLESIFIRSLVPRQITTVPTPSRVRAVGDMTGRLQDPVTPFSLMV
jgi:hypothetical protein